MNTQAVITITSITSKNEPGPFYRQFTIEFPNNLNKYVDVRRFERELKKTLLKMYGEMMCLKDSNGQLARETRLIDLFNKADYIPFTYDGTEYIK